MASSDSRKNGLLVAYDALAAPGTAVNLVADLLEEGFLRHSPLGGEVLLFEHRGRALGRTLTGGDGRALISFTPKRVGVETVSVRLAESRRVAAQEATAGIFVWDRRRPIVIVSAKALMPLPRKPAVDLPLPRSGATLQNPDGGAVHALAAVAKRVHVLYVIAGDRLELPEVRRWVNGYRLPPGPVFLLKPGPAGLSYEVDRRRQEGWTNIRGGLVVAADEAKALVEKGLKAVVPPTASSQEKWPEKAVTAKDWTEVARHLAS